MQLWPGAFVEIRLEAVWAVAGNQAASTIGQVLVGERGRNLKGCGAKLGKAGRYLIFRAPRVGQKNHFKNIASGYLTVTGKRYAKLA
ncbi:hypothetical protein [Polaromonas sp. OV174]|uniref:hypothetical protein n=1 Tax=Polaromonas sp. OV174 TaxID=1855300 RepID=UPI00116023FF|nr:hypothetical protein [Polaromonas sp. OV174]